MELDELLGAGTGAGAGAGAGSVAGAGVDDGAAGLSSPLEHAASRLNTETTAIAARCVRVLFCIISLTFPKSPFINTDSGATGGSAASTLQPAWLQFYRCRQEKCRSTVNPDDSGKISISGFPFEFLTEWCLQAISKLNVLLHQDTKEAWWQYQVTFFGAKPTTFRPLCRQTRQPPTKTHQMRAPALASPASQNDVGAVLVERRLTCLTGYCNAFVISALTHCPISEAFTLRVNLPRRNAHAFTVLFPKTGMKFACYLL